jgi:hypothetical protein
MKTLKRILRPAADYMAEARLLEYLMSVSVIICIVILNICYYYL